MTPRKPAKPQPKARKTKRTVKVKGGTISPTVATSDTPPGNTYSYEIQARALANGMVYVPQGLNGPVYRIAEDLSTELMTEAHYCPACGKLSATFAEAIRHHEKGCES